MRAGEISSKHNLEIEFKKVVRTFWGRGGFLPHSNIESLKHEYQSGLETLVVRALNQWTFHIESSLLCKLTRKCLAWGVKLQR